MKDRKIVNKLESLKDHTKSDDQISPTGTLFIGCQRSIFSDDFIIVLGDLGYWFVVVLCSPIGYLCFVVLAVSSACCKWEPPLVQRNKMFHWKMVVAMDGGGVFRVCSCFLGDLFRGKEVNLPDHFGPVHVLNCIVISSLIRHNNIPEPSSHFSPISLALHFPEASSGIKTKTKKKTGLKDLATDLQRLDDFGKLDRITQGKDDEKKEDEDEDGEEDNDNVEEEEEPDEYTKQHSQQQTKQKARILDAIEDLNFRVRKKNQLLHKKKIIGFPTHRSCASPLLNSFDAHDLLRVVPTYHQDEDDQDAQHKAFQDDNPTITEVIHVEYSLNNNFKIETPMVIEEDEKLLVFTSTKVHEQPMKNKSIDPKEPLLSHGASQDKRAKRVKLQN
ncbi:hypothetical protein Tco_0814800 [Tanacetum coccineum]